MRPGAAAPARRNAEISWCSPHPCSTLRLVHPLPPVPLPRSKVETHPASCRLLALVVSLCVLTTAIFAAPPAAPNETRVLTVSAATDNFPYSFRDAHGRLAGYGVDMLDAVAEVMHVRLERVAVSSVEDVANLDAGRCDIGQFHATTPGRTPNALYSQPILINTGDVFVRAGGRHFTSLEELRHSTASIAGHVQAQDYLIARGFTPERIRLATSGEAMRALAAGEVDAVLTSRLTGLTQAHHLGIRNVEPLGWDLRDFRVAFCIATRGGDRELLEQINEALATLSTTGRTEQIYARWFGRYETRRPTLREMLGPAAAVLALALIVTIALLRRQYRLRRQVARQAEELRLSHEILAEAQRFAQLGHSRRTLGPEAAAEWSEETFRIFEFDPAAGVPAIERVLGLAVPADRERWREALDRTQWAQETFEFDVAIVTASGRHKIVNVRGRPTFDAAGRQDGTFGTVQDVTASRAAAAALQQSELLLRALYEHLPIALSVVEQRTGDWHLLSANPEAVRQLALPAAPADEPPLAALRFTAEVAQFWRDRLSSCIAGRQTLHFEYEADNRRDIFSIAIVPLLRPGAAPRCCLLSEKITARKLKDAELAQSRRLRAIGELVGGIAHEFNNLITPIVLNTELILRQNTAHPELRADLEMIADAARRAGELTRRLLAFGRRTESRVEAVDLAAAVAANVSLVRHTFDRRIVVANAVPAALPRPLLPAGDFQQIILNLLLNARDALASKLAQPPAPDWTARIEITGAQLPAAAVVPDTPVRLDPALGWLQITVRDNGCGMTAAVRERLFEPFFTTKAVGSGTGLGLATIWHLVAEFGGRIEVESVPDEGTAFHLYLPQRTPAAEPPPAPTAPAPPPPIARRHFLLAEDEDSVARVVGRLLERQGHRVTIERDGLRAFAVLAADPASFDAVIMDLNMPGLSGTELARKARALPYDRPLLVMSGRITEEEREKLTAARVDALLDKPFSIAQMEETLARVFAAPPPSPQAPPA